MNTRRYDIDWLRIIAVLLLLPFHTARIFDLGDDFYAKSGTLSKALTYFILYLEPWHMPLLFFLAGASTWFALSHRDGLHYAGERFKRLLLPFVFGLVVLIPPQSYLGLVGHSGEAVSVFSWFPTFFRLNEADLSGYFLGGMTFGHLWFIVHLFFYSLIALPIVLFLRRGAGRYVVRFLAWLAAKPAAILLFGLFLAPAVLVPEIAGGNPIFYGITFLLGYLLMADSRFEQAVDRHKLAALILGPVGCVLVAYFNLNGQPAMPDWAVSLYHIYAWFIVPWCCLLAMLGYGRRFLRSGGRVLKYAAPASYPMYLLHQTIIVAVGFVVLKGGLGVSASFVAVLIGSFVVTLIVYEVVRRVNVFRLVFGMKWVSRGTRRASLPATAQLSAPQTDVPQRATV
jgi:peptidoglycan/LPS O-acetylase OafA/YrhL